MIPSVPGQPTTEIGRPRGNAFIAAKAVQDDGTPMQASPEEWIVAIAETQDRGAFVQLFTHMAPRIKAYFRKAGVDGTAADDLVQDVMLTVWRRAVTFDPAKASASTWMFTIARNRRIDIIRRENRPSFDPHDPAFQIGEETPADVQYEKAAEANRVEAALKQLPDEQRQILQMSYYEDKSHSVIARELDIPLGTVKSRMRLAAEKLRGLLHEVQ